jgi:hypothetical protein
MTVAFRSDVSPPTAVKPAAAPTLTVSREAVTLKPVLVNSYSLLQDHFHDHMKETGFTAY